MSTVITDDCRQFLEDSMKRSLEREAKLIATLKHLLIMAQSETYKGRYVWSLAVIAIEDALRENI